MTYFLVLIVIMIKLNNWEKNKNAVRWSSCGTLLASCSDDSTAKLWRPSDATTDPLLDLRDHEREIYTLRWSPTGDVCLIFMSTYFIIWFSDNIFYFYSRIFSLLL